MKNGICTLANLLGGLVRAVFTVLLDVAFGFDGTSPGCGGIAGSAAIRTGTAAAGSAEGQALIGWIGNLLAP